MREILLAAVQFGVQLNSKAPREVRKLFESLQLGDQDQEPPPILWVPRPTDEKSVQPSLQPAVSLQGSHDEVRAGEGPDTQEGQDRKSRDKLDELERREAFLQGRKEALLVEIRAPLEALFASQENQDQEDRD